MTSQTTVKTLLILGASGDLTGRLLLPGLARLVATGRAAGLEPRGGRIGSLDAGTVAGTRRSRLRRCRSKADAAGKRGAQAHREKSTAYHQLDVTADGPLAALLAELEGPVAVYFALPPQVSQKACEILAPGAGPRRAPGWSWRSPSAPARSPPATQRDL